MKNKPWIQKGFIFLLSFILIFSLAGCAGSNSNVDVGHHSPRKPGSTDYPLKLKDQAGNIVEIKKEPQRIVSLVPSATEIAFALSLDDKVKAVTSNDDYPAKVKNLPKVGDMKINAEKVFEQKPDLVLASSLIGKDVLDKLKQLKLTVLILDANSTREVYQSIDLVALASNKAKQSDELIAKLEKKKRDIYRKALQASQQKKAKVWIEVGPELFTVGGDGLLHEMVELAGGENVAKNEKGWPQISSEKVITWNPDVIISTYGGVKEIQERKGWENVNAIKNKRVIAIDPNLSSRSGPRVIDGVEKITQALYPQALGVQ